MNEKACFPYALSYQSDRVTCFLYVWLGFVYPRSHSGWLGQLANLEKLNLQYNQLTGNQPFISLTCIQYEWKGLLSLCPFIPVRWRGLFSVCFDWVLYTPGPIPAELGQLANLLVLYLEDNQLTGTLSLFPTDLPSLLRHRLAFTSEIVPVGQADLFF